MLGLASYEAFSHPSGGKVQTALAKAGGGVGSSAGVVEVWYCNCEYI